MPLNRTELCESIRDDLGCPSQSDISDKALKRAIDEALRVFSKHIPFLKDIQVTVPTSGLVTVADDIVAIIATSWHSRSSDSVMDPGIMFGFGAGTAGGGVSSESFFDLNNLAHDVFLHDYLSERAGVHLSHHVVIRGKVLEFLPAPSSGTETARLRIGILHTDATFPDVYFEILKTGSVGYAARKVAMRRAKFPSISIGSDSVQVGGTSELMELSRELIKEFKDQLGQQRLVDLAGA